MTMGSRKISCGCLNVKIHAKSTDLNPIDQVSLGPVPENDFFSLDLAEVQLSLEGVAIQHESLMKTHTSQGWTVYTCANCEMSTHAVLSRASSRSKVIVNTSIKNDKAIIERLSNSSDYSPLYKIVLRSEVDNHPIRTLGVQSEKYESLQQTLTEIQQQLNKFLLDESNAMEERIRQYEESQRSAFAELQSKARRDKNAMMSLVLAAQEEQKCVSSGAAATDPNVNTVKLGVPSKVMTSKLVSSEPTVVKASSGKKKLSSTSSDGQPARQSRRYGSLNQQLSSSPDAGGVFDMEPGFQDDTDQPFYESDDDNEDTDDSSMGEETGYQQSNSKRFNYSSSVPVSVPMWKMAGSKKSYEEEEEEDDYEAPAHPEDMAASIKALAQSVHADAARADGSAMFGELPSRATRTRARPTIKNFSAADFGEL